MSRVGLQLKPVCVDSVRAAFSPWMWLCLQKLSTLPPPGWLQPEIARLRDLLPRVASHLLIQLYTVNPLSVLLYTMSPLPVRLYTANPPPRSVLYHKSAESLGCWCISIRAHSPPNPSLSIWGSVCLSFLHALIEPVRSSTKMCRSNKVQSHAMPIVDIMILGNSCRVSFKNEYQI